MNIKTCIKCGKERFNTRKLCPDCFKQFKREYAKDRYKKYGRHKYNLVCIICNKPYKAWRREQKYCTSCYKLKVQLNSINNNNTNNYIYVYDKESKCAKWEHREIAKQILNRKLKYNEIVHHLDNNPKNNKLDNLILISRQMHGRLHKFLDDQKFIIENKPLTEIKNWDDIIVRTTESWLETSKTKYIKLSEYKTN